MRVPYDVLLESIEQFHLKWRIELIHEGIPYQGQTVDPVDKTSDGQLKV